MIFVFLIAAFILFTPIVYLIKHNRNEEFDKCMSQGRGWAVVSSTVVPAHISGKIWVPATEKPIYGCVEVK